MAARRKLHAEPAPEAGRRQKAQELRRILRGKQLGIEVSTEFGKDFENYMSVICSQGKGGAYERMSALFEGTKGWLDRKYLGHYVKAVLDAVPPLMLLHCKGMEDAMGAAGIGKLEGELANGEVGSYVPGTNVIRLRDKGCEADRRLVMLHELLHYCCELGSEGKMFWVDGRARGLGSKYPKWLDEGLTEMHAQQRARGKGMEPTYVSYEDRVLAAMFIQRLVGERLLRRAYLEGDFTRVKDTLDRKLKYGIFEELVAMRDAPSALAAMAGEAGRRGLDGLLEWFGVPEWRGAFRKDRDIVRAVERALGKK